MYLLVLLVWAVQVPHDPDLSASRLSMLGDTFEVTAIGIRWCAYLYYLLVGNMHVKAFLRNPAAHAGSKVLGGILVLTSRR